MKCLIPWLVVLFSLSAHAALTQFEGTNLITNNATQLKLSSAQKGFVVIFMSSKCPCSNSHVLEIKALAEKYKEFVFVGIHSNSDEDPAASSHYFKKIDFPFSVLQDKKFFYANELKANKTPHSFILSPEGKIIYRGGVTNSSNAPQATKMYLREALEDLVSNKALRHAETRTLGCAIMREGSDGWQ